jgi:radical SAM-linked protein
MKPGAGQRLRLRYRKDEVMMYVSHLDLLRYLFKLFRRTELPYALSGGFSPKPRVNFGPPLPLGVSAANELLDIEMAEDVAWGEAKLAAVAQQLAQAALPRELVAGLFTLPAGTAPISRQSVGARYEVHFSGGDTALLQPLLRDLPAVAAAEAQHACRGLTSIQQVPGCLNIDGQAGGSTVLNVVRLAGMVAEQTGMVVTRLHRSGLLDKEGVLL